MQRSILKKSHVPVWQIRFFYIFATKNYSYEKKLYVIVRTSMHNYRVCPTESPSKGIYTIHITLNGRIYSRKIQVK